MATPSRPFGSMRELHANELACLEAMARSGIEVAVPAALNYCTEHGLNTPPWLLVAATGMFSSLLKLQKSTKRGRSCGVVARYRQDMIDYARWDQIMVVRERQLLIREQIEELRTISAVPCGVLEEHEKTLAWLGSTLNRAFECAAMLLRGTSAFGSPEALKRSYFKVRRNSCDPDQALRYRQLNPSILKMLGLGEVLSLGVGRKPIALYELTY
jgi:hypothetical protein